MVEFDLIALDMNEASAKEQLAKKWHPAIRVQIKTNNATRWIKLNLDSLERVNGCIKFNGILSQTFYSQGTTLHQESDIHGWYVPDRKLGGLTIF